MSTWYDRLKKERILIQTEDNHSKFWAAYLDEATLTAHVRWGRLGTKGQSQEKTFGSVWEAGRFIDDKYNEKNHKGYRQIEQSKFDRMVIAAAVVGTQNKCSDFTWVEVKEKDGKPTKWEKINEEQLADPNCNPGLLVGLETKKTFAGRNRFELLFTFDRAFNIAGAGSLEPIVKGHYLYEFTQKVEEALGRTFAG